MKEIYSTHCPYCLEQKISIEQRKYNDDSKIIDFYLIGFMEILRNNFLYTGDLLFEVEKISCRNCKSTWIFRSQFGNIDPRDSSFGPDFVDLTFVKN